MGEMLEHSLPVEEEEEEDERKEERRGGWRSEGARIYSRGEWGGGNPFPW